MNIQNMIVQYLFNPETKDSLVKALNENINIPIIGEKTEEKIIIALWDTVEEVLKKAILK
tara:strand:+ start:1073 stop:1252 length:180 start_codon:yes stop_codon:yes gene_type:complete